MGDGADLAGKPVKRGVYELKHLRGQRLVRGDGPSDFLRRGLGVLQEPGELVEDD